MIVALSPGQRLRLHSRAATSAAGAETTQTVIRAYRYQ